MKPILTSSFSGLSEPCAQTAVRRPGSRPDAPTAAAPWIRVRRVLSIFGEGSVFICGLAMADGMKGDLEPARACGRDVEARMRGTGAARKRDRLVQEAPRGRPGPSAPAGAGRRRSAKGRHDLSPWTTQSTCQRNRALHALVQCTNRPTMAGKVPRRRTDGHRVGGWYALGVVRRRRPLLLEADHHRLGRPVGLAVEDRLDVVAVGIDDEGAVVARVVLGADAGLAVVLAAGGERGGVEAVDGWPDRRPGTRGARASRRWSTSPRC